MRSRPSGPPSITRISVRGLYKIFQYHGTTFGQVLLQERPQQAHLLIIASGQKGTTNLGGGHAGRAC
jgi:hypothetical protein